MSAENKNEGKVKWSLIFKDTPNALLSLARVAEKSIRKYTRLNWSESIGTPDSARFKEENLESIIRHAQALLNGEEIDQETGEHHGGHIMRRASFCVEYYEREKDQRPALGHGAVYRDEFLEYYKTLEKQDGLDYFIICKNGYAWACDKEPSLAKEGEELKECNLHQYPIKAPKHLQDRWTSSLRKLESRQVLGYKEFVKDPAWEIDQLVSWDYHCSFWCFYKNGDIYISDNAPEIKGESYVFHGYTSFLKYEIPKHLWKHWKESIRKKPEDKEYAWEIDQLVTWIGGDFKYWYFEENGYICYGSFAPKFSDNKVLHSAYFYKTTIRVPEHLRKYWKESVRKKT